VVRQQLVAGRVYRDLVEINERALAWCREDVGQVVHGTTQEAPLARFEREERAALKPLPATAFLASNLSVRACSRVYSERHNRITGNIFFHLRAATRGHSCRALMADMKLRVAAHRAYYYPDVMLVCDPSDDHPIYKTAPCFVAEVLSPGTAAVDQREKWLHYRDIPSLRYYLLVDSEKRYVRLLQRTGETWQEQTLGREDSIQIECGELSVPLSQDDLYEDTGLL
jgi:Uma2 family endonuclease